MRSLDDHPAIEIYSIGTCLVQWSVVLVIAVLFNRKLAARALAD